MLLLVGYIIIDYTVTQFDYLTFRVAPILEDLPLEAVEVVGSSRMDTVKVFVDFRYCNVLMYMYNVMIIYIDFVSTQLTLIFIINATISYLTQEAVAVVVDEELSQQLETAPFYSLLIDESTDIATNHTLIM